MRWVVVDSRERIQRSSSGRRLDIQLLGFKAFEVDHDETGRIPQLVAEIAGYLEAFADNSSLGVGLIGLSRLGPLGRKQLLAIWAFDRRLLAILLGLIDRCLAVRAFKLNRHPHVLRLGGQPSQTESQSIGPKFVDDVDRIDAIALALGHGLAIAIQDLGVNEDFAEGNLAHIVQAHQHHAGDPQRDDVAAGDQRAGRIEVLQFRRLFRPAEGRMRPQGRTEPGVEHVRLSHVAIALQHVLQLRRPRREYKRGRCRVLQRLPEYPAWLPRHSMRSTSRCA